MLCKGNTPPGHTITTFLIAPIPDTARNEARHEEEKAESTVSLGERRCSRPCPPQTSRHRAFDHDTRVRNALGQMRAENEPCSAR